jgi:hypothetical protein
MVLFFPVSFFCSGIMQKSPRISFNNRGDNRVLNPPVQKVVKVIIIVADFNQDNNFSRLLAQEEIFSGYRADFFLILGLFLPKK